MHQKDQTQFGIGAISIKKKGSDFIALVLNGGFVDSSWTDLAEKAKIIGKKWWVFKFPISDAKVLNNRSEISKDKMDGYGFDDEEKAVKKFDSLSEKKIGKITPKILSDKDF